MTWREIKRLYIEAGLHKAEVAKLLGVSRQTLYNWDSRPPVLSNTDLADRVEQALEKGELPIVDKIENRMEYLRKLLID